MTDWIVVLAAAAFAGVALWIVSRMVGRRRRSASDEASSELILPRAAVIARLDFDVAPGQVFMTRPDVVIGRHSDDDIVINDVRMSRRHARLRVADGRFQIENLTVARPNPNTMLVNGTEKRQAYLIDGDVVTLGGVNFAFHKGVPR